VKIGKVWLGLIVLTMLATLPPPAAKSAGPQYFYINTANISLHSLPLFSSPVTGTGQLNDRVEKLGDSPKGWTKVRNLRDGRQGWLPSRYLARQIVSAPLPASPSPRKRLRHPSPPKKAVPPAEKEPEPIRPKPM